MNVRDNLERLLKKHGHTDTKLLEDVLEVFINPHGLTKEEVKLNRQKESRVLVKPIYENSIFSLNDMFNIANYGMDYALSSQHQGFIPKGNVLQYMVSEKLIKI